MPTEAQILAAARAIDPFAIGSTDKMYETRRAYATSMATAALTAAEAVEVSEEDAAIIREYEEYASGWTKTLTARNEPVPHDVRSIGRLCALARRGAGQVVPDGWVLVPKEPTHEMENAMFGSIGDDDEKMLLCLGDLIDMSPNKTWLAIRAAYLAAIAAAPKPEDKP